MRRQLRHAKRGARSRSIGGRPSAFAWVALVLALAAPTGRTETARGPVASHVPDGSVEPERVVTLEFLETEIALALGLPVVGVADRAQYHRWVGVAGERLADAASLGGRSEPSLEKLVRLRPDLIISSTWRHAGVADRLAAIAPLLLYRDLPRPSVTDQYTRMRAIVRDMGARTGRESAADALLARLDERLAGGRRQLAEAGLAGAPVVLGQVIPGSDRLRLYTDNSLAAQVLRRLGFTDGRDAPPGDYGFREVELGELAALSERTHLILAADPDSERFRRLTEHPVWSRLGPVAAGRFHRVPRDIWLIGGPLSAMRLADQLVRALVEASG